MVLVTASSLSRHSGDALGVGAVGVGAVGVDAVGVGSVGVGAVGVGAVGVGIGAGVGVDATSTLYGALVAAGFFFSTIMPWSDTTLWPVVFSGAGLASNCHKR